MLIHVTTEIRRQRSGRLPAFIAEHVEVAKLLVGTDAQIKLLVGTDAQIVIFGSGRALTIRGVKADAMSASVRPARSAALASEFVA